MQKIKFLILPIIIFLEISCYLKPINKLENTWLLVEQTPIKNGKNNSSMFSLDGMLLHFDKKTFTTTHVFSENEAKHQYQLEENYIQNLENDTLSLGEIIYLSEDSLVIRNDKISTNLHFVVLQKKRINQFNYENIYNKITSSILELKTSKNTYQPYCDTMSWQGSFMRFNDLSKFLFYNEINGRNRYERVLSRECWSLKEFQGKFIFTFTTNQMSFNFFIIKDITKDSITGMFKEWDVTTCIKTKITLKNELNTQEQDNLKQKLIGKWRLNETKKPENINSYKDSLHLVHNYIEPLYGDRIQINDFKNNDIEFIFSNNGSYNLNANKRLIRKGEKWDISKDGKFLYLDSKYNEENFFEIIELSSNKIILGRHEEIVLDKERPLGFARISLVMVFEKI